MKNAEWCIKNDYNFENIVLYKDPFNISSGPDKWFVRYFENGKFIKLLDSFYIDRHKMDRTYTPDQMFKKWLWEEHNNKSGHTT